MTSAVSSWFGRRVSTCWCVCGGGEYNLAIITELAGCFHRRSLVKKQPKISQGAVITFILAFTPGLPLKPICLGTLSFHHQTNLLVPEALIQLAFQIGYINAQVNVSSSLLGNHILSLSLEKRLKKLVDQGKEISAMDSAKAPCLEEPMKLMVVGHWPRRRRSIYRCWQSEALRKQVMNEVLAFLYAWENSQASTCQEIWNQQ